jgi:hypothetical protein
MRRRPFVAAIVLAALASVTLLAPAARAGDDDKDEPFETTWFGATLEAWLAPTLSLHGRVGGSQSVGGNIPFSVAENSELSAQDLGVDTSHSDPVYLGYTGGPLVLGTFVDTRWVSLSAFWITPFQYKGSTVLSESISYAGATFTVGEPISTTLAQSIAGFDIRVNILNNRFVRVSPVLALRALAIDWGVKSPLGKVDSEEIDFPLAMGNYEIFPYPELGAEVRAGYRDFIEADVKLTGLYIDYLGVTARTLLLEAGVTGYLPFFNYVGLRIGYRYYFFDARTNDQSSDKQYSADLRLSGATITAIVRF